MIFWSLHICLQIFSELTTKVTQLLLVNFGIIFDLRMPQKEILIFSIIFQSECWKKNEIGFYSRSLIISSFNTGLVPANLAVKTKSLFIFYLLSPFTHFSHLRTLATTNLFSVFMHFLFSYSTYERNCMAFVVFISLTFHLT